MNKGIRPAVCAKFAELNPARHAGEMGNTEFRKEILFYAMENFGISVAAAATAYNYAKHEYTKLHPELVVGLGRAPEKNNGGRKKKVVVVAEAPEEIHPVQTSYTVKKKSDNTVVLVTEDFTQVQELVQQKSPRVNGKFTGKLYWV